MQSSLMAPLRSCLLSILLFVIFAHVFVTSLSSDHTSGVKEGDRKTIGFVLNPRNYSLSPVYRNGVYLLPEAINEDLDGDTVISVRFCGIHNPMTNVSSSPALYLYILILRNRKTDDAQTHDQYVLRYKPLMVRSKNVDNVCDMVPVTLASLDSEARWIVSQGDRLGVYIPPGPVDTCINDTDSLLYPAYVAVRTNDTSDTVINHTVDILNQTIQNLQSCNLSAVAFNRSDFSVQESMHLNVEFTFADSNTVNNMTTKSMMTRSTVSSVDSTICPSEPNIDSTTMALTTDSPTMSSFPESNTMSTTAALTSDSPTMSAFPESNTMSTTAALTSDSPTMSAFPQPNTMSTTVSSSHESSDKIMATQTAIITRLPNPSSILTLSAELNTASISVSVSVSVCVPPDPDCLLDTLPPETQIAIGFSSFGFLLSLISVVMIATYICIRVSKRRKKKLKRSMQRARAPTTLSDAIYSYANDPSSIGYGHHELQENNVGFVRSNERLLSDGQYDYANNAESTMNRLPPFPVSTDGELRSHDGPLRSTNGFATLGYEFDDNLVDGRMRPRVVSIPNEYQYSTSEPHDYEQPFFEPANQEEDLLQQLRKVGVREIPEERLKTKDCLGSGQFGVVYRGLCQLSDQPQLESERTEVAVKTLESGSTNEDRIKFLQEAAVMGQFDHPNILSILGIVTNDPMRIVVSIMHNGDLRKYLKTLKPSPGEPVFADLASLLLSFSRQVSLGMMYLAFKEYVHRDLAARNVLVSKDGVCKVADFGMSRDLQNEDYYRSHGGQVPVKWTAPEALNYRKYSTASDVWSYGCLLYEIWSLGEKPYGYISNVEVLRKVMTGYRLPPPPGCPRSIYEIMIKCWNPTPSHRISIAKIVVTLTQPEFQILRWADEDVSKYSTDARTLGTSLKEGHTLYESLQKTYMATD